MAGPDLHDVTGARHCGSVGFVATVDMASARRCNCSMCRMRGAVAVSALLADFSVTRGADVLSVYTFNTGVAQHYFCSRCGIYTHHQRRSDPTQYGVNVGCIDGVSPFDFTEVEVLDGAHHLRDGGNGGVAGILRYETRDQAQPSST